MRFTRIGFTGIAIAALMLAACATTGAYHARDGHSGYAETELGADHWIVEFVGDGFTARETVDTYLLYRAAELTAGQGREWFTMAAPAVREAVEIVVEADRPQVSREAQWRPQWRRRGRFFWSDLDMVGPMPNERERADEAAVSPSARYSAHAEIFMGNGAPPAGAFNAQELIARLGPSVVRPRTLR